MKSTFFLCDANIKSIDFTEINFGISNVELNEILKRNISYLISKHALRFLNYINSLFDGSKSIFKRLKIFFKFSGLSIWNENSYGTS